MFDLIELVKAIVSLMVNYPAEFSTMLVLSVSVIAVGYVYLKRAHNKDLQAVAETCSALYAVETIALELLRENQAGVTKTQLREFAFAKSNMEVKVFPSRVLKKALKYKASK